MSNNFLFTSESVTEGHPDKMADQISDSVLDALIAQDPKSRVACETLVTTGLIVIAGEVTTNTRVDYAQIARETVKRIGYDASEKGFDYKTCGVVVTLDRQSPDISQGVTTGQGIHNQKEQGAGDQGIMFGYAVNESEEHMPLSIDLAQKMAMRLTAVRKNGTLKWLRPDGKTQVTIEYENDKPKRVDAIVVSSQHDENITHKQIQEALIEEVVKKAVPSNLMDSKTKFYINPTGRFVVGGPMGDCGLTGRKIIVDTYGGHGAHGGGAFSGKDPSKVDRSACYMARYVAKNIVAAGLADKCLVQLAYAIGVAEPVSVLVNAFGTEKVELRKLDAAAREIFHLRPAGIIESLNLLRPIYAKTAAYGHFGRAEPEFTWERTDKVSALKALK
ncbi:MAG: methionine adenosyltransferase [Bdellovibrionales bacterium RIFOXYD1_FULL_53_11]|nr:MAG: methionine adenosyltransferase [Bdellovibrionales bacterium RIFOXYD1_FULL_53_11]